MDTVLEKVKEVISEQLDVEDVDSITTETTFIDDLGADSLDIVELIMALEEEAEKITSVGDVVNYIEDHQ